MCLAYFFGFFGISFLDTNEISKSPSTFGLSELQHQADAKKGMYLSLYMEDVCIYMK
jgi:hypothetical protein